MSFNKSIFPFLIFGILLQSCGSDTPVVEAKPKAEVATHAAKRELADAKVDAMIDTATPSELETVRQTKAEEAEARETAENEARIEKEKERKEKRAEAREEREKKAKEERRRKRREKRKAKKAAEKLAAEQAAKTASNPIENAQSIPVEYQNSSSHSSTSVANGTPVISFYKTIHKYGTIEQGDKVEYKFKFKNVGKSELVVMDATASCGCTKPSYPFIPIEPGGEGYIGVIFDSKGKLGRQKPSVVITTNANPASYTIYLEGYVDSADKVEEANNDENDKKVEDGKSF